MDFRTSDLFFQKKNSRTFFLKIIKFYKQGIIQILTSIDKGRQRKFMKIKCIKY